jgi:L-cysteine S-thiosulfotransferase
MRDLLFLATLILVVTQAGATDIPLDERRSGFDFMTPQTQAMQRDDTLNPGLLWIEGGRLLWQQPAGENGLSCVSCHGDGAASMRGVAARYPAFDETSQRPIDLQGRIDQCRHDRQKAPPLAPESEELLSLSAYVASQSRGMPIAPPDDERLTPFRERGRQLFERRLGQLDLSCSQCHDGHWGQRLGGSTIPQAHPTGYPIYRLEWQGLGSLQRRFRNCLIGVRAESFDFGAPDYVELELYLMARAQGLPMETPAVRP